MKIRAIMTGATGMVGEGVLHECLLGNEAESILVIKGYGKNIIEAKDNSVPAHKL